MQLYAVNVWYLLSKHTSEKWLKFIVESRYREGLPAWVYSKYGVLLKKVGKVKKARLIFEKGLALQDKDSYEQLLYQYGYLEYE